MHNSSLTFDTDIFVLQSFFSVKTAEEVNERMNGLKMEEPIHFQNWTFQQMCSLEIPQSVDWTQRGLVSPVRNQVRMLTDQLFERGKHESGLTEFSFSCFLAFTQIKRGCVGCAGRSALWGPLRAR